VIETRIRFDVRLSGSQDIFGAYIEPYTEQDFDYQYISFENHYRNQFEITLYGQIYGFYIKFEEHEEWVKHEIQIPYSFLGKKLGIICVEQPNPNNYITYAGGFAFSHPTICIYEADYYSITPNKIIDTKF